VEFCEEYGDAKKEIMLEVLKENLMLIAFLGMGWEVFIE
jgi:hypothetical protein